MRQTGVLNLGPATSRAGATAGAAPSDPSRGIPKLTHAPGQVCGWVCVRFVVGSAPQTSSNRQLRLGGIVVRFMAGLWWERLWSWFAFGLWCVCGRGSGWFAIGA